MTALTFISLLYLDDVDVVGVFSGMLMSSLMSIPLIEKKHPILAFLQKITYPAIGAYIILFLYLLNKKDLTGYRDPCLKYES